MSSPDNSIGKALVILSPDLIQPDDPLESTLIKRATDLARQSGCELELFHICYDDALDHQLFITEDVRRQQQEEMTDRNATVLAEIAARLQQKHVRVTFETRWGSPRTDTILRKIEQSRPDVVMKQSREHNYLLGLISNTDWDLARNSPVDVWLVNDKKAAIDRVVAAVGNQLNEADDITTAVDYRLFQTAKQIANTFEAEIYPVNAYTVAGAEPYLASAGGMAATVTPVSQSPEDRARQVKRHTDAVKALAQFFEIGEDNVHICEGHPNKVIPETAENLDADMIVMGASNISRWERLVNAVVVEPVMEDSTCDILVVRENAPEAVAKTAEEPIYGKPRYDLEQAIIDPRAVFRSPREVAEMNDVSAEFRERILQAWEYDIRAPLAEENEGGPVRDLDLDADALNEIENARNFLDVQRKQGVAQEIKLSAAVK